MRGCGIHHKHRSPMGVARSKYQADPMGESRFHKVLVLTAAMQKLPALLIVLLMVMLGGIVALAWEDTSDVPLIFLTFSALNWVLLWMLPKLRLSYGPEKASALALALMMFIGAFLLGILNAPDWLAVLGFVLVTAVVFYSTYIEPFNLRVTRETLKTRKFAASSPPLRLLHIADIHVERLTPRERRLNKLIEELKPDVIVFSGDFVNISYTYDDEAKEAIQKVIRQWNAPLGVYCVPGTYTVEPAERVKTFVKGLDNLTLLLDRWVTLDTPAGQFSILGMVTRHILETDQQNFARLIEKAPREGLRLLLTHAPDVAPDADKAGIDLYLCGHTHGGQIRMPIVGALFSGSHLGMRFVMGRKDLRQTVVYTSRGVGLEGLGAPRARFLCPPEIILWEIRGE
jgi:uncharacterized protein